MAGSVAARVERYLRDAIREGTHPPGSRLPSIRDLATLLGVSTSSVRTALANLEASGVITTRPGSGSYVAALDTVAALAARVDVLEQRLTAHVAAAAPVGHSAGAR